LLPPALFPFLLLRSLSSSLSLVSWRLMEATHKYSQKQ
jgi:hypothetical protein